MNSLPTFSQNSATLTEKLAQAEAQVRARATAAEPRVYLFQLLCVLGKWERALAQLQICAQFDSTAIPMAQTYREAIRGELVRESVFAGRKKPSLLGDTPEWASALISALALVPEAASIQRQQAFESAAETPGLADGLPFGWIADGDSRLGPVCEVISAGQYWWVPFERIDQIVLEVPQDLRDLVWIPATVNLRGGSSMAALLPSRYPGSGNSGDDTMASVRMTCWTEAAPGCWHGSGQKMWVTDSDDLAVLDCRSLKFQQGS